MKTVIDAVNEFKGEFPIGLKSGVMAHEESLVLLCHASHGKWLKGFMYDGITGFSSDYFDGVCNESEFNDLVSQMETNFGVCANIDLFNYTHGDKVLLTKSDKELEVMDIDWSKAPEGKDYALVNDKRKLKEFFKSKPVLDSDNDFMVDDRETLYIKGPWQLFERPIQSPVFTQEMCDNGELPSVGMECLINFPDIDNAWYKYTIDYMGKHSFIATCEDVAERFGHVEDVHFKPLTPPIELIDGNWYLVKKNYGSEEERVLHRNQGTWFYDVSKFPDNANDDWTVISKLTVEVK